MRVVINDILYSRFDVDGFAIRCFHDTSESYLHLRKLHVLCQPTVNRNVYRQSRQVDAVGGYRIVI